VNRAKQVPLEKKAQLDNVVLMEHMVQLVQMVLKVLQVSREPLVLRGPVEKLVLAELQAKMALEV
jgi:hypothetical protein